jgi:hypothetical protein
MANKEELLAEAKEKGLAVPEGATKAEVQALLDDHNTQTEDTDETTPAEQADKDVEKSGVQGVKPGSTENTDAGEGEPDAVSEGANDEDQTVAPQADGIDGVDRDHTPAGTTEEANQTDAGERLQPPVAANGLSADSTDEAYNANNATTPGETPAETKARENEEHSEKVQTRLDEAKEVETELGTSEEEAAAARAGVQPERLNDPKQNRQPKNEFEVSNQKVTEEERQAAQEVSDMTTADKEEQAPTPNEQASNDAQRTAETNQSSEIAQAIAQGFKASKDDSFTLQEEPGVEHRFTLVRNKATGEVMIRENETGTLSKIQLLSLEEKENDVQKTEVEEL